MKLFLISAQDYCETEVESLIKTHFGDNNIALDDRDSPLWIISAPVDQTPAKVAEMLDMVKTEDNIPNAGLVVQVSEYYGFDSKALWQQLDVWSNE